MSEITTGIVFGDVHAPEHDRKAINVLKEAIKVIKPGILIDLGDGAEMGSINHWNRLKPRLKENKRLAHDLSSMYGISKELADCAPKARLVKLIGNHEHWVDNYVDAHPELEGIDGINVTATYEAMGWSIVPWGAFHREGKLLFHHGDRKGFQQKYSSGHWAASGKNIVYGHRHEFQSFTHESIGTDGKPEKHRAWSIGCLRSLNPNWMQNNRNNWQQGFGVFYIRPGGWFAFYPVDITNGTVIWAGKTIKA